MARVTILRLVLAVQLIALVVGRTYIDCSCSASQRGYGGPALEELRDELAELRGLEREMRERQAKDATVTDTVIRNKLKAEAIGAWNACVVNFSYEECANADAALRFRDGKYRHSFCAYNRDTWRSGGKPTCDTFSALASADTNILAGKPEHTSTAPPQPNRTNDDNRLANTPGFWNGPTKTPAPNYREAALPIPSQPSMIPVALGTDKLFAGTTSANVELVIDAGIGPSPEPSFDPLRYAMDESELVNLESPPPARLNEGCVAVQHLRGHVLQHSRHLLRPVLCAHKFCATPNHAIIVDGEWTSMKKLCDERTGAWRCVHSVRYVNNLKVAVNRRVVVNSRITVTPYDIRFPRWAVWGVQIAEDFGRVLGASVLATVDLLVAATVAGLNTLERQHGE